jgi:hypothetical protein
VGARRCGSARTEGPLHEKDLYHIITEFHRRNPRATIPETVFPKPALLPDTKDKIIADILELLNNNGLTSAQSMDLVERLGGIIEMGQRIAKGMTHSTRRLLWNRS